MMRLEIGAIAERVVRLLSHTRQNPQHKGCLKHIRCIVTMVVQMPKQANAIVYVK